MVGEAVGMTLWGRQRFGIVSLALFKCFRWCVHSMQVQEGFNRACRFGSPVALGWLHGQTAPVDA